MCSRLTKPGSCLSGGARRRGSTHKAENAAETRSNDLGRAFRGAATPSIRACFYSTYIINALRKGEREREGASKIERRGLNIKKMEYLGTCVLGYTTFLSFSLQVRTLVQYCRYYICITTER